MSIGIVVLVEKLEQQQLVIGRPGRVGLGDCLPTLKRAHRDALEGHRRIVGEMGDHLVEAARDDGCVESIDMGIEQIGDVHHRVF